MVARGHITSFVPPGVDLFLEQVSDFTDVYISILKPRGAGTGKMATERLQVIWSPVTETEFATYGNELRVYNHEPIGLEVRDIYHDTTTSN